MRCERIVGARLWAGAHYRGSSEAGVDLGAGSRIAISTRIQTDAIARTNGYRSGTRQWAGEDVALRPGASRTAVHRVMTCRDWSADAASGTRAGHARAIA